MGWARARSVRHSLDVPIPEADEWQIDDRTTPWLVLRHAPTRSALELRTWRAPRRVDREQCERQARLWRPDIPAADPETVVERRQLTAPAEYATEIVVGVGPDPGASGLLGYALAFGATVQRCYAFVYTTHAAGTGAEAAIARRLGVMADEVAPRVRVRSIDDRVR